MKQVASPCYSAWCPTSPRASFPHSPASAGLLACPHLSGYIWPTVLLDLFSSGGNHKLYRYWLDSLQFIFVTHFKVLDMHSFPQHCCRVGGIPRREVNGYKDASVPYYHFLELCLELRSSKSFSCLLNWTLL